MPKNQVVLSLKLFTHCLIDTLYMLTSVPHVSDSLLTQVNFNPTTHRPAHIPRSHAGHHVTGAPPRTEESPAVSI